MKKMMFLVMMMTIAISSNAMPYATAREEALFLSDKMAYELGLTDAQYEAVYEINLDYLLNMGTYADINGPWWDVRNRDLRYVLSTIQYDRYLASTYFYRPLVWHAGNWHFTIYNRYSRGRMFLHRPAVYVGFRGGHSHRGASFYAGRHFNGPSGPAGHRPPTKGPGHGPSVGHGHAPSHGSGHGHAPSHGSHGGNHGPRGGHR